MTSSVIDPLQQALVLLGEIAAQPTLSLSDEDLCALTSGIESAGRLVDATRLAVAAEIDDRSRFELGKEGLSYRLGHRRGVHLVEQLTRVSQAEATRRIRVGSALRPRVGLTGEVLPAAFPQVAASVAAGAMGVDAAAVVTRCLGQADRNGADPAHIEAAERELVDEAVRVPADQIAVMARVWREALDPDGAQPREEKLRQQRHVTVGRERDGMVPFWGAAPPVEAAELKALFSESMAPDAAPRFVCEEDVALGTETVMDGDGVMVTQFRDPRTRGQRQFDVFFGMLRAGSRSTGVGSTAKVLAVVKLDDLESGTGVGWLDNVDEPVSVATVQELVCDSGFQRLILGPHGEVLALGREERYFTYAQRLALAGRDGGCVWPQCTAPPSWCHAHHVVAWADGGDTDIENGVLLCAAHHHMLHASEFQMKMFDGRPHLLAPVWLDPAKEWQLLGRPRLTWARAA